MLCTHLVYSMQGLKALLICDVFGLTAFLSPVLLTVLPKVPAYCVLCYKHHLFTNYHNNAKNLCKQDYLHFPIDLKHIFLEHWREADCTKGTQINRPKVSKRFCSKRRRKAHVSNLKAVGCFLTLPLHTARMFSDIMVRPGYLLRLVKSQQHS